MPSSLSRQVFFDPSKRRWRHVSRVAIVATIVVTVLFGTIAVGVFVNPGLPKLVLPMGPVGGSRRAPSKPNLPVGESAFRAAKHDLKQYLARSLPPLPTTTSGQFERIAFFVNWDDNSWVSLKRNLNNIDTVTAEWLHLDSGSGAIVLDEPAKQKTALEFLRRTKPGLKINALINNFKDSQWDRQALREMLASSQNRGRCIEQIRNYLLEQHLAGINIDFESVPNASQKYLVQFMRELAAQLKQNNLEISESVPIDDAHFKFRELIPSVDYLMLMAYDENASDNDAGPIASQQWFTREIQARLREVPANKIVIGIGSYGYDWKKGKPPAEEISFQDAVRTAAESQGDIALDDASGNPHFSYDDDKQSHVVWFLDAVTAFNQLKAAARLKPRGFALWRLGSEDPAVWSVLRDASSLNAATAQALTTMQAGYDLDYRGKGEILRVTGTPKSGTREVHYDPDIGLLTDDVIKQYPSAYVIERWGFNPEHVIALTFDDGPDPEWTPKILQILKAKQASATFFVIGGNAESNPTLLRDIFNAGNEIGNHTYTHPNIANASDKRVMLELNATQRLLESRLGVRSLLFRPPYAEDVEPETPDQVHPLMLTSSLGYYSVGMQIDPDDWARPGADVIVQRVLDGARAGDGNVVLLHDSGGDRSQTVAALPRIIDALRSEGFKFVTISDLLHVPRASIMPAAPTQGDMQFWAEGLGFKLVNGLDRTLRLLFITGIVLGVLRFILVLGLATVRAFRRRRQNKDVTSLKASVIVPAYNEEQVIVRTVQSLLDSTNIEIEILVVDDGSTDGTAARVTEAFSKESRVRLLQQTNAGKAAALNHGIRETRYEIIVVLDADTLFLPDTASMLARDFADAKVGAVAGNTKVGNRNNLLTRWQALEYITSQNLDRRAFEVLNCITVVPGAVGAWRRSVILQAGGFSHDTLAEDADLTMRIVRLGSRVLFEEQAVAYTEAPQGVAAFLKQRFRWMFGTLQASWKHRGVLLRLRGGTLGLIALPNVLVFQIFFPLVSPVMDLLMLWTTVRALLGHNAHPSEIEFMNSAFVQTLYYYSLFLAIDIATAVVAYLFEPDEDWHLLLWLPLQRFFYRQLIYYVAIKSLVTALRGPKVGWGKLQRYGSVQTGKVRM